MKLTEAESKSILADYGVPFPSSILATTAAEAASAARDLGTRVVVKAQVRSGGRGKAGGVIPADNAEEAQSAAGRLLDSELNGERVSAVLVEQAVDIASEHYVSVAVDTGRGGPVLMRSDRGGVDVESEATAVDLVALDPVDPPGTNTAMSSLEQSLVTAFADLDALTVEVNPLAVTSDGDVIALDAKIELDDAAAYRHPELHGRFGSGELSAETDRERAAAEIGLRLIELGGDVAVLANGAGLTMATMDAIEAVGGRPANFLEIGGDAYTKATPALELVLGQPGIRSLLVNFCGAFARCDVMVEGVIAAWEELRPDLSVAFSVGGTGRDDAVALLRDRLGVEPHPTMESAVRAAVTAADVGGDADGSTGSQH